MYVTTFTVVAPRRSLFPLDMLRYDRCAPHEQHDVGRIENSLKRWVPPVPDSGRPIETVNTQRITLIHYHADKTHRITPGRWSSFGWSVDPASIITRKF